MFVMFSPDSLFVELAQIVGKKTQLYIVRASVREDDRQNVSSVS